MAGGQTLRRVGIEFSAKDNLSRVLKSYADKLQTLGRVVEKVKRQFASLDRDALRGLAAEAEKIGKVNQALGHTVTIRLSEARAQREALKLEGMRASQAAKAARDHARTFEAEESALNRVLGQINKLEVSKRQIHRVDRQIRTEELRSLEVEDRRLINAQRLIRERLRTEQLEGRIHRQLRHQTADQDRLLRLAHQLGGVLPLGGNLLGSGTGIARMGLTPARAAWGLGHDEAVRTYLHERTSLEQMNLGSEGNRQALGAAERVRQRVRGLDMADALDVIKDLVNITGSVHDATHGPLPEKLARFRVANRVAYGLTANEGYSAIKAAEMLTAQRKDMSPEQKEEAVASRLELINKVMGGSGGKIRPGDVLQFAKTAQASKFSLSEQGIYHLAPILQELGGMRTGTSLMSLMQNLANGRMTHASAQNMMAMGLLDPGKVEYDKVGRVKRALPGSTVDSDLLREDPVAWVEKHVMPKLKGKSQAQQDQVINSILSNRTAAGLVATIVAQHARIMKDSKLYQGARTIDEGNQGQRDLYLRAELDFQKALETLRQKLAIMLLPSVTRGLNSFTGLLEGLNKAIENHPLLSKLGAGGIIGGGVLVAAAGTLAAIVGTIRTIASLGGAARVLGLVAAELAVIQGGGVGAGARGAATAAGAGAAGAAAGSRLSALRGAFGRASASLGRGLASAGGRVASLGALGGSSVAAAGALPVAATVGTGAIVGVTAGQAIQRQLERTGAADAIQNFLAWPFMPHQQRQVEPRLSPRTGGGTGDVTIVINGPVHTTASDTKGLVRDLVRAAARSGSVPRSGSISPFAYPQ